LCFGTIKVPQNSERSTEEAVMSPREVGKLARRSIEIAHERLNLGEALLVFAEGSRSRSGEMQRFLSGTARYLGTRNVWVLPVAIAGTERLFPIDGNGLNAVPISVTFGQPISAEALRDRMHGDRRMMMDAIGFAVAELLPPEYRGVYEKLS
jgi:1-acyl-sn-glycerol-3-phosphate acyltransferase